MDKEIAIDFAVAKLELKPGDVVVVRVPGDVQEANVQYLDACLEKKGIDALVICGEVELSILRRDRNLSLRKAIRELGELAGRVAKLEESKDE